MEIIWTERAVANLEYFKNRIRRDSGSDIVAERFYAKVIDKTSRLESKPDWIGIPVKEYPGVGYKSLFVMEYRIIFRVIGEEVYIVSFLHKKMLIEGRL